MERGALKTAPREEWKVYVAEDGMRATGATDLEVELAFDRWSYDEACERENGIHLHHRIGNISPVAFLRERLDEQPDRFPVLPPPPSSAIENESSRRMSASSTSS